MRAFISLLVVLVAGYAQCDEIDVGNQNVNNSSEPEIAFLTDSDQSYGLQANSWKISSEQEICTPNNLNYQYFPISGTSFEFKVRAQNDAHITLTETPGWGNPTYEIVLGGWQNTRSIIRENNVIVASVNFPGIVNECDHRSFWIRWDNSVVRVGYNGINAPFLSYNTGKYFNINFIGIHTGYGSIGNWIF